MLAEVAVDRLVGDQPLDGLVAVERLAVERPPGLLAVALDQLARTPLVARVDDAAVARRGAPAERLRLEERDRDAAPGELARRVDPGVAAADDDDVGRCPAAAGPTRSGSAGIVALPERPPLEVAVQARVSPSASVASARSSGRRDRRHPASVVGRLVGDPAAGDRQRARDPAAPCRAAACSCRATRAHRRVTVQRSERSKTTRSAGAPSTSPAEPAGAPGHRARRRARSVSASIARSSGSRPASTAARTTPERRLEPADPVGRRAELDRLVDLGVRARGRWRSASAVPSSEGGEARQRRPRRSGAAG